ncbi:MAG: Crp/Fnr family transcriptional regulator [Armatimonadetes bacterium]|nr:Crp/Fnr family transcriptional regulator [Armatimonadota bacterium]
MGTHAGHSCLWYIRKFNFFPTMTDEERMDLAKTAKMVIAKRGETIAWPRDSSAHAWLVKEGRVRLVRWAEDGRTLATDLVGPGEIIGETAILTGEGDADAVEAVEDVILCRVSAEFLRGLCVRNPKLTLHISKLMGLRKKRIETRLADLLFCTVKVRIARLLLQLAERFGSETAGGALLDVRLTHQDIGELVGANREAATRAVLDLKAAGLIAYVGRRILIKDSDALKRAGGQS